MLLPDASEALPPAEAPWVFADGDCVREFQTEEELETFVRFDRRTNRTIKNQGHGATDAGIAVTESCLPAVTEGFQAAIASLPDRRHQHFEVVRIVRHLAPEKLALAALSQTIHSVALQVNLTRTMTNIANVIYHEAWAAAFQAFDEKREKKDRIADKIEAAVRDRNASVDYRVKAARAMAQKAGFSLNQWPLKFKLQVGAWAVGVLLEAAPDLFERTEGTDEGAALRLTERAMDIADRTVDAVLRRYPVFLPSATPPEPWTGWSRGGPVCGNAVTTMLRSHRKDLPAAVNAAVRSGQLRPTLDALNAAQDTPWVINRRVLDVLRAVVARDIRVEGIPQRVDIPKPAMEKPWDDLTDLERRQWRIRAHQVEEANRTLRGERLMLSQDLRSAERLEHLPAFWVPHNLDWRGRVYGLTSFNFQRSDRVRGLFLFRDGEPIGVEGLWWLKVHVANCGDFGKVSKAAFEDRARWADEHMHVLRDIVRDPLAPDALKFWTQADKPFLFLAGCFELVDAVDEGPGFISRLPCSWDGSCSGLQHLSAMTRADEGRLVNLAPTSKPQDVYQTVAERVAVKVAADLTSDELYPPINQDRQDREDAGERNLRKPRSYYAQLFMAYGINRKLVKRNVMTYSYSSGKYGMTEQHREDTMRPLRTEVLLGERDEHPFGADNGHTAAKYIAEHIHATIEEIVERPAMAMTFLQKLAKVAAHEGKCVKWTTPAGLPWENRYRAPVLKRVALWLHDRGVKVRITPVVADGETAEVDKRKVASAVAPNFVHACDASHLLLTINAAKAEGITSFALVHDSFGVLASRSGDMHRIIRETFVKMYEEHDVLGEILEQTRAALSPEGGAKLPEPVTPGNLNLKDVLNARYAFA